MGNKYHNKFTEYNGEVYHSMREAAYAQELDLRVKAKDIVTWSRQISVKLDVKGKHICTYVVDFVIIYPDLRREYIDVKGMETPVFKLKKKLFEAITGNTLTIVR